MLQQYAKAENLSCLLNTDKELELIPEPFRMQRNVLFKVTYSEYVTYVLSLRLEPHVKLMTDSAVLINMAHTKQPKLYNHFLQDMSFALMKEIFFAEHFGKKGTIIMPASYNDKSVLASNMVSMYPQCLQASNQLVSKFTSLGYIFPKVVSVNNSDLFKIAVVLYHLSLSENPVEEMNVVYDLA